MVENISGGIVEDVINRGIGKGSGLVVSGVKYGAYDPSSVALDTVAVGDQVDFMYTVKGAYKNIKGSVSVTGKGVGSTTPKPVAPAGGGYKGKSWSFPIPALDGQRAIVRQNSVTNATNLVSALFTAQPEHFDKVDLAEEIINLAKRFEEYSTGDLDSKEADEKIEAMKKLGGAA